jgi:hypothetical protein
VVGVDEVISEIRLIDKNFAFEVDNPFATLTKACVMNSTENVNEHYQQLLLLAKP